MKSILTVIGISAALAVPLSVQAGASEILSKQKEAEMKANEKKAQHKEGSNHATNKKAGLMEEKEAMAKGPVGEVRDWAAIDTDKDHSISSDEMEKYLQETWAKQAKK